MTERRKKPRRDEDKLAFYPWYPRDFEADGPVKLMTLEEEGAYHRLLDYQWLNERLPEALGDLAKICKNVPLARMKKIWAAIGGQFPGGQNGRLERERQAVLEKSAQAKAAAATRWDKHKERTDQDADAHAGAYTDACAEVMPTPCYPKAEANTEAITTPQHGGRMLELLSHFPLTGGARIAVTEFIQGLPVTESADTWIGRLIGYLGGMGTTDGKAYGPEVIVITCRDWNPKGKYTALGFRAFCDNTISRAAQSREVGGRASPLSNFKAPARRVAT